MFRWSTRPELESPTHYGKMVISAVLVACLMSCRTYEVVNFKETTIIALLWHWVWVWLTSRLVGRSGMPLPWSCVALPWTFIGLLWKERTYLKQALSQKTWFFAFFSPFSQKCMHFHENTHILCKCTHFHENACILCKLDEHVCICMKMCVFYAN